MTQPRAYEAVWQDIDDGNDLAYMSAEQAYEIEPDQRAELLQLSYRDYLRSPHWDHMRRRALLRAGHQCQQCEARTKRLHVHHLTYDRLGRESEGDLVVLCDVCHARLHGGEDFRFVAEALSERDAAYIARDGLEALAKAADAIRKARRDNA